MPPFPQFLIRRIFAVFASLVVITMILYAGVMLTPPEARARLYVPPGKRRANGWNLPGDGLTEALDPTATHHKWTRSDAS